MILNPSHSANHPPPARTKYLLIAGFSATLSISVILAVAGLSFTHTNLAHINEIVESNNVKAAQLRQMHTAARERSLLLHTMLDINDPFCATNCSRNSAAMVRNSPRHACGFSICI